MRGRAKPMAWNLCVGARRQSWQTACCPGEGKSEAHDVEPVREGQKRSRQAGYHLSESREEE